MTNVSSIIVPDISSSQESMYDVAVVEEECVQAFTQLVVQLSETLFRPMFLKV